MSDLHEFKEGAVDGYVQRGRIDARMEDGVLVVEFTGENTDHLKKQLQALADDKENLVSEKFTNEHGVDGMRFWEL